MGNPEYPDLPFVTPRWWHKGRDGWPNTPRVIVVHYTAGSEGATSAEDGASWDTRRPDATSAHYYIDQNSIVQCVATWDMAYTAYPTGNHIGIHYELCGTAQSRAQWLDPASDATITRAARQMARDAAKYRIPVRRLTLDQLRAGYYGFAGHGDITAAFHQGDHTDPGSGFPWDVLLARVAAALNTGGTTMPDVLVKVGGDPAVWRANGVHRYHIPTMAALDATVAASRNGELPPLWHDGEIRSVGSPAELDGYGLPVNG